MKLFFFLFFLTSSSLVYSQTNFSELERVNGLWSKKGSQEPFTGEFVHYFHDNLVKSKGWFKNGLIDSSSFTYYENGTINMKRNYSLGVLQGETTEFFTNGKIKLVGVYKDGKKDSIWNFYSENGNLNATKSFSMDLNHGDHIIYDENGKIFVHVKYINGKEIESPDFEGLTEQALELENENKFEEAIKLYDQAIELNPTLALGYFNRANCKVNNSDFEGAIMDFNLAIEIDPSYMEAFAARGNAKIQTNMAKGILNPTAEQTESACNDFHMAISLGDKTLKGMISEYCD